MLSVKTWNLTLKKGIWNHTNVWRSRFNTRTRVRVAIGISCVPFSLKTQLTHVSLVSDQGHEFLSKIQLKWRSSPDTPQNWNGLVQLIRIEKATRQIWVNFAESLSWIDLNEVYSSSWLFHAFWVEYPFDHHRKEAELSSVLQPKSRWIKDFWIN